MVGNCLERQSRIDQRMWIILLDWVSELHAEYGLERSTYHAAVNYLERFLCQQPNVPVAALQLLGAVCVLTASQLHEQFELTPPLLSQLTDSAYSVAEIVSCQALVLHTLDWDLLSALDPVALLESHVELRPWMLNLLDVALLYPAQKCRFSTHELVAGLLALQRGPLFAAQRLRLELRSVRAARDWFRTLRPHCHAWPELAGSLYQQRRYPQPLVTALLDVPSKPT